MQLRKLFIDALLILVTYTACGQSSIADDTTVIKTALNHRAADGMQYLSHSVGWVYLQNCMKPVNLRSVKINGPNGIPLSKTDRRYIRQQIKQLENTEWLDSIFYGATRIADTEVWKYFDLKKGKFAERQKVATENKDLETLRTMQHEQNWIYGFSKPIYLHNGTHCLIYTQALCGNACGRNEAAFYKLVDGAWVKLFVLGSGDF